MAEYGHLPSGATLAVKPYTAHVEGSKLEAFKQLLALSPIAPPTFESSHPAHGRRYGVTHDWLTAAKEYWLHRFDWRAQEAHINSFPNFITSVPDDLGNVLDVHFLALFSRKAGAVPLVFYHGWPGSILEFLPILSILKDRYTPETLPYHVVVPSIPGYAYSSGPPTTMDYGLENAGVALNNLMEGLGLTGYYAQGGDLGAFITRDAAQRFPACKGMHLNFCPVPKPENADELHLEQVEKDALPRGDWFASVGRAYAAEHGTRTATIGFALSASPLALLSWVGEKFLEWSDEDPSLDVILADVTLYWLTDTLPRCIYPYRGSSDSDERPRIAQINSGFRRPGPFISKPSGYSFFPKELRPIPVSWAATSCNLVHPAIHTTGGHFAALEKPNELLADVEAYIKKAEQ